MYDNDDVYFEYIMYDALEDGYIYKTSAEKNEQQKKKNESKKGYIYFKCDEKNKKIELKNGKPFKDDVKSKKYVFMVHNSRSVLEKIKRKIEKYKIEDYVYAITDDTIIMFIKIQINARLYGGRDIETTYNCTADDEELNAVELDLIYWEKDITSSTASASEKVNEHVIISPPLQKLLEPNKIEKEKKYIPKNISVFKKERISKQMAETTMRYIKENNDIRENNGIGGDPNKITNNIVENKKNTGNSSNNDDDCLFRALPETKLLEITPPLKLNAAEILKFINIEEILKFKCKKSRMFDHDYTYKFKTSQKKKQQNHKFPDKKI